MRQSPVVSVVIPCHNARPWIGETLSSVVAQRGVKCEVVVIDDGSTDGSAEVAVAAARLISPFRIIQQPHSGVSRARNVGTRATSGRYIQYLDADDLLEPGTLAARVAALERSVADIAYCDWCVWERQRDGSFGCGPNSSRTLGPRPDVELLTDAWWPPGAVLFRRNIVEQIGPWNEGLRTNQDMRFLLCAASMGAAFIKVVQLGLRYRVHGENSLSRGDSRGFLNDCYRNAIQVQYEWEMNGTLDELRREGLLRIYRHLSRVFQFIDDVILSEVTARIAALSPMRDTRSPRSSVFTPHPPARERTASALVISNTVKSAI